MKNLLIFLGVLWATMANAALVTVNATFTNRSLIGSNFVVNGATVTYTNAPLNSTAWIVTNSAAQNATNLQRYLGANYPSLIARMTNATNVTIYGQDLQFSFPGNGAAHFAFTTTNSQPGTNWHALMIPFDNTPFETNRTNDAEELVYGLNKYVQTNSFKTNAQVMTNFLSLGPQTQTFSNKIALNTTNVNGISTNGIITNAVRLNVNLAVVTNLTAEGGVIKAASISNAPVISGVSNFVDSLTVTQSANLGTNATGSFRGPKLFSGQTGSEVLITNDVNGTATLIIDESDGSAGGGILFNFGGVNIWSLGGDTNDWGIYNTSGNLITLHRDSNGTNIMLGGSLFPVSAPAVFQVDGPMMVTNGITNQVVRGTNSINAEVSLVPRVNSTVISGYASAINLGTNAYVRVTGASAAITNASFKGGYAGLRVLVEFVNPGLSCVLLDHSAIGAPTASEKINNGTGGLVNMTNNPAMFELMHNGTEWIRLWNSN